MVSIDEDGHTAMFGAFAIVLNENGVETFFNDSAVLPLLDTPPVIWSSTKAISQCFSQQNRILSPPMFVEITAHQQERAVDLMRAFVWL